MLILMFLLGFKEKNETVGSVVKREFFIENDRRSFKAKKNQSIKLFFCREKKCGHNFSHRLFNSSSPTNLMKVVLRLKQMKYHDLLLKNNSILLFCTSPYFLLQFCLSYLPPSQNQSVFFSLIFKTGGLKEGTSNTKLYIFV